MPSPDFKFVGVPEFQASVDRWVERTNLQTRLAMDEAAKLIQGEAGRKIHSRTGALAGEWDTQVTSTAFGVYTGATFPTVVYAPIVQFGKRGAYHKPAYPYMPDFDVAAPLVEEAFVKAWTRAEKE